MEAKNRILETLLDDLHHLSVIDSSLPPSRDEDLDLAMAQIRDTVTGFAQVSSDVNEAIDCQKLAEDAYAAMVEQSKKRGPTITNEHLRNMQDSYSELQQSHNELQKLLDEKKKSAGALVNARQVKSMEELKLSNENLQCIINNNDVEACENEIAQMKEENKRLGEVIHQLRNEIKDIDIEQWQKVIDELKLENTELCADIQEKQIALDDARRLLPKQPSELSYDQLAMLLSSKGAECDQLRKDMSQAKSDWATQREELRTKIAEMATTINGLHQNIEKENPENGDKY